MIGYFGGKSKMADFIIPRFFPKNRSSVYVEPFSGAFWLYFNLKYSFSEKRIVYNDLNKYMVNLFYCAKSYQTLLERFDYHLQDQNGLLYNPNVPGTDEYKNFYKELYNSYNSNRKTEDFLDSPKFEIGNFDAAVLYAFLLTSTFNGCFPNSSSGPSIFSKNKTMHLMSFIEKLKHKGYRKKLDGITDFHNLDFEEIISLYDDKDSFFYFDPPYFSEDDHLADFYGVKDNDKFGSLGHKRVSSALKAMKSKWILSYYYYDDLEKWFPKDEFRWENWEFHKSSTRDTKKEMEIIIMNYKDDDAGRVGLWKI